MTTLACNSMSSVSINLGQASLQCTNTILGVSGVTDISCSGSVTATNFKSLSDRRLKENIVSDTIDAQRGDLAKLMQINVSNYKLKGDDDAHAKRKGVIAQELEEIFPEAVEETSRYVDVPYSYDGKCIYIFDMIGVEHIRVNASTILQIQNGSSVYEGDVTKVDVLTRVKVVDYEYLMMVMLNSIKVISRSMMI